MLGRDRELGLLRGLVDRAQEGTSGVLVLHGVAGAGKTALLDQLAREASERGLTVLRATGVASESTVAFSGLAELLRLIAPRLSALPSLHAAPLAAALALGPPAGADRFVLGVATLGLLAAAASTSPVVALVDDVQWLDAASAEAIAFAGRRLAAEGVVLVLARRDGIGSGDGAADMAWADELAVGPLDASVAAAILAQGTPGPIAPSVAKRLLEAAGGNALALVGVPRLLSDDQRRGRAPLPNPLPLPESFERELTDRLRALPDRTRRALTVAAAHAGPETRPVMHALDALGLELADLAPAEAVGVMALDGGVLTFDHPLMRSAAYHAADPADRRAAHAALATALGDGGNLEARARHLAAALVGPDDDVARCLEEASEVASRQGALQVAADLAVQAAAASGDSVQAARRRIRAAELALLGGSTAQATALLEQVGEPTNGSLRTAAAHMRGRVAVVAGSSRVAAVALAQAAEGTEADDPIGAAVLFVQAAAAALSSGRHAEAGIHADRAVALAAGAEPVASLAELVASAGRVVAGSADDGARLLALYRRLEADDALLAHAQPALLAATSALVWLEDFDRAELLVDAVIATARQRSTLEVLPVALVNRAWIQFRRPRVTAGIASATEALELAEATGQGSVVIAARHLLAHLASYAGRYEEARSMAGEVLSVTDPIRLTPLRYNAVLALAGVEMATGRHAVAAELLEGIVDPASSTPFFQNPAAFGGAFQLVDCYIRLGRTDDAERLLGQTEAVIADLGQPWPRGQAARLRGLLEADYDTWFAQALALVPHVGAAEVATRIDWARRLEGDGRTDEAHAQLQEAFAVARRTGYHSRTPDIVAGLGARGDDIVGWPDDIGRLSGQELAVAASIVAGATVPETATELFLSPQTVERAVVEACRKLGVASVTDLAARLRDGGSPGRAGWTLSVLGAWRVQRDGVDVTPPPGRAGTVVQLLAAVGGRAPTEEVIEHLWPEIDPELGRVRLRNVIARVRRAMPGCVDRHGEVLAFARDVEVDAITFRSEADTALAAVRLDRRAAVTQAAVAVRSYRGALLPDAAYESWAEAPREQLRRRYLELLDLLAGDAAGEDRWEDAARFRELAVEADPDDHERYVAAAEVRLRQGRLSSALHLCRQARQRADDDGVPWPAGLAEIEAEVRDLQQREP